MDYSRKNEIVLLYLDQHMGWNEILRTFNIPGDGMLQRWIEQYRKFGTLPACQCLRILSLKG